MTQTSIEWTDVTWNPLRGCSRVSEGCRNCYAERIAARFSGVWRGDGADDLEAGPFIGIAEMTFAGPRWTGKVELVESKLLEPLRWRKPRRVFVNSMSDLFHEGVPDETIARVFNVMASCPQHTFQILTKRADRMHRLMAGPKRHADWHPGLWHREALPNVWLGVSAEDQARTDERIPLLLQTPAAHRFVSLEPLLGAIDVSIYLARGVEEAKPGDADYDALEWIIIGGESGPGARPCDVAWIRSLVQQAKAANVPAFVKQVGSRPYSTTPEPGWSPLYSDARGQRPTGEYAPSAWSAKGGDMSLWPEDLRDVRDFPRFGN